MPTFKIEVQDFHLSPLLSGNEPISLQFFLFLDYYEQATIRNQIFSRPSNTLIAQIQNVWDERNSNIHASKTALESYPPRGITISINLLLAQIVAPETNFAPTTNETAVFSSVILVISCCVPKIIFYNG